MIRRNTFVKSHGVQADEAIALSRCIVASKTAGPSDSMRNQSPIPQIWLTPRALRGQICSIATVLSSAASYFSGRR